MTTVTSVGNNDEDDDNNGFQSLKDILFFHQFILFQQNEGHEWPLTQICSDTVI